MTSGNSTTNGSKLISGGFGLLDTETANVIGHYATLEAALADVADTVRRFGRDSDAALNLALFRWEEPMDEGEVASGDALIERALAATATDAASEPVRQ